MDLQLQDKVTVITGPAKGMGRAVTLAFAEHGARLVLAGRDTAAIEPVAAEARALGVPAIVVPCDLTNDTKTEALARHALEAFGRIDILVNVAGGSGPIGKTGWETSSEEFNEIVQLNMTGCFNPMHAVLPWSGIDAGFSGHSASTSWLKISWRSSRLLTMRAAPIWMISSPFDGSSPVVSVSKTV